MKRFFLGPFISIVDNVAGLNPETKHKEYLGKDTRWENGQVLFVKLRQGSGKDRQGMALKAKGVKA